MSRFTIGIVRKSPHSACFEEVAKATAHALRTLGHETVEFGQGGRLIMFGAQNMTDKDRVMPEDAILYNSEQIASEYGEKLFVGGETYKTRTVWEYAEVNIAPLKALGCGRVIHCPVGYISSMANIKPTDEDIDVLFYGSKNDRRAKVLDGLEAAGLKVKYLFGVYGDERDAFIARSKIVLNMHYYDRPIFEIFRVSHLLANRKCVVSEGGGIDATLEAFANKAVKVVKIEEMVETCRKLIENAKERQAIANNGFAEFSKVSLVESVFSALERS